MKRMLIGWILTVLLLMGGGALAQEEHFSFILPDNENLASVAVGEDGTLFIRTYQGLFRLEPDAQTMTELPLPPEDAFMLTGVWDGKVYMVNSAYEGLVSFYALSPDGETWSCAATLDTDILNYGIKNALLLEGCIYCTLQGESGVDTLLAYDIPSGETKICGDFGDADLEVTAVGLFPVEEGVATFLYDYDYENNTQENWLLRYDRENGSITREEIDFQQDGYVQAVARDDAGMYWMVISDGSSGALYQGASLESLAEVAAPLTESVQGLIFRDQDCLIQQYEQLFSYRVLQDAWCNLVVANYQDYRSSAFLLETGIAVTNVYQDAADILTQKNGDVDIICLDLNDATSLRTLKEKGYFVDLNANPTLKAYGERLYPRIQEALTTEDGKLVAWLLSCTGSFMQLDLPDEVMEEYGLTIPTTFGELLDEAARLQEETDFYDMGYQLVDISLDQENLVNEVLKRFFLEQQAQGGKVDFHNPELRALLERILTELPVSASMDYEAWPALMWGGCTSPISANDLLLPRIGENSPDTLGVHVNLAVVNPYSDQPEEAMAYLEYLALHNGMDDYMLYADMTQPLLIERSQQRLEEIDQALAELAQQEQNAEVRDQVLALEQEREFTADNLYLIGEADIAAWQKAAAAMVIPEENFYTQEIMQLRDRLLQGSLSLDGFLDQCSQHMEMIYAERGE